MPNKVTVANFQNKHQESRDLIKIDFVSTASDQTYFSTAPLLWSYFEF